MLDARSCRVGYGRERFAWLSIKKIGTCDARKIFAINQISSCQIERSQMRGVLANFAGVDLSEQIGMAESTLGQKLFPYGTLGRETYHCHYQGPTRSHLVLEYRTN